MRRFQLQYFHSAKSLDREGLTLLFRWVEGSIKPSYKFTPPITHQTHNPRPPPPLSSSSSLSSSPSSQLAHLRSPLNDAVWAVFLSFSRTKTRREIVVNEIGGFLTEKRNSLLPLGLRLWFCFFLFYSFSGSPLV